jgi:ribosomal protein S12 methylthiotransferase accessory factor
MKTSRRLSDILEYLVDSEVGIINTVKEVPIEAGAPDFFRFYCFASDTQSFNVQPNSRASAGSSADRDTALAKAMGEAVERYCSAIYDPFEDPVFSYDSAPSSCISPKEFALYSKEQYESSKFSYVPFINDTTVRWTLTLDPLTSEYIRSRCNGVYAALLSPRKWR